MDKDLQEHLADWLGQEQQRVQGAKKLTRQEKAFLAGRAGIILKTAAKNRSLRVLRARSKPVAVVYRIPSNRPRIKNQQALFFMMDREKTSRKTRAWIKEQLRSLGAAAPRATVATLMPGDEKLYRSVLLAAGFQNRYEILKGDTKVALRNLRQRKDPPRDLTHAGLNLVRLTSASQLKEAMRLQKSVILKFKRHGYFSHTPKQLREDLKCYREALKEKSGVLLGVYQGSRLRGLMAATIHPGDRPGERTGSLAFFLHPSIHGQGITKTGYRIFLEFFVRRKVRTFWGGTSQPAIQHLSRLMKRQIVAVIYVK
ncbi:MAG: hypothetical protein KF802_14570 [Bdellovibrionaceae bacterium]|nr:hypothetical protein [Pseudobdellovibrionaceae bacterium]